MRGEVPGRARMLAARLAALFRADVEIVARLNVARRRLRDANERLWSCGRGSEAVVLGALEEIHWQVHLAFCDYQFACEERRQLAVDVGELSWQLTEVLCAAGWSEDAARDADVQELATAGAR